MATDHGSFVSQRYGHGEREGERERESKREQERARESKREQKRERERVCVCVKVRLMHGWLDGRLDR